MSLSQSLNKSVVPNVAVLISPDLEGSVTLGQASGKNLFSVTASPPSAVSAGQLSLTQLQAFNGLQGTGILQRQNNGTQWTQATVSSGSEYLEYFFNAPAWIPTVDYSGQNNYALIVYGTNTNTGDLYPNNIFFSVGTPAVGVPPTSTPAPYPATTGGVTPTGGPTPNAGWVLAATYVLGSGLGSAVVTGSGGSGAFQQTIFGGFEPLAFQWGGGGRDSIGTDTPLGMTLTCAGLVGAGSLNGAKLQVAGTVRADAFSFATTDQSLCPASSYNAKNPAGGAVVFQIGQSYTWTAPVAPATTWAWVAAVGTPGTTTINGGTNASFSPDSLVFLQSEVELSLGAAKGILSVQSKTNTSVVIHSLNTSNALETGDTSFFQWMVMNPNWGN